MNQKQARIEVFPGWGRGVILPAFLFLYVSIHAQVLINEVQTSDFSTIQDEYGKYEDWIEIYNAGSAPVNLDGYGLSDDAENLYRFRFPSHILNPQDHLLIFASDSNQALIGTHWESAVRADHLWRYRANLTDPVDTNWRNLSFNESSWSSGIGLIGYGDGDDSTIVSTCASVFLRKSFSVSDTSKILEGVFHMDYDDGFVAYLNGVEIARTNVGLPGIRPAWDTPAYASNEGQLYQNMPCDSYYVSKELIRSVLKNGLNVLAVEVHNQSANSNDLSSIPYLSFKIKDASVLFSPVPSWFPSNQHPEDYFHTAFKISKTGETIYLTNASASVIDQVLVPSLEMDDSYGRNTDGDAAWKYFETPTPDTSNNLSTGQTGYATIPVFSLQSGFYSGTQTVTLSTTFPGGIVRYTTNGNTPTDGSAIYTSPLIIDSTTTIRSRVFSATSLPSVTITNTYFINLSCKLPVYSLVTDSANLWDYNTGIFVKGPNASPTQPFYGANYWQDWEKMMSLEFFDKQKNRAFKFNAGLSITGGWSRRYDQKSVEVKLGDKYGLSKIEYEMIPDKSWIKKWDNFLLHTTGNDRGYAHMRDPVMEHLMKGTHSGYTAFDPCLLYINGQQWGVYYTKENEDHHFVKLNFGYDKNEIDLLKESYKYHDLEIKQGSDAAFRSMHSYAINNSPSSQAYFTVMDSLMDLKNQVDYFAAECYYPNDDWMGGSNNNLKIWKPDKPGGRFRYILYDLDYGFGMYGQPTDDILAIALNPNPHNYNSDIFQRLLQNSQYKNYFINRYADLMNTNWLPSNVLSMVNSFKDSMRYDMHFQYEKWGNGDTNTWKANIDNVINFSIARPAYARQQIQNNLGMTGQVTLTLQVSPADAGRIQISTITPSSLPWSGVYFNGNPVTVTAIPNPGYTFDYWRSNVMIPVSDYNQSVTKNYTSSDIITAHFTGSPVVPDIILNEINFNSDSASNAGDWIELHNRNSVALDLSGWKVKDDDDHHEFIFPVSTVIAANGYLVIAEDLEKFHSQHPSVANVIGETGFNLSDGGDLIRLFMHNDSIFLSMEYSDELPWPEAADGDGYTFELMDPAGDLNDGNNWFAGCLGGSPGAAFTAPIASFTISGATTICSDDTLLFTASASAGNNYQWQLNHANIPGASNPIYRPVQSGTYCLIITNNGCSSVSDSVMITVLPRIANPQASPVTRCGNGTVTLEANATDTIRWFDSLQNFLFTGNSFTTPELYSSTTYYVQAGTVCASAMVSVAAVVIDIPDDPVIPHQSRCGAGSITLVADTIVSWYDAPSGNLLHSGTTYSPFLSQSATYYAQAGDLCKSNFVEAQAIINPVSADPVTQNLSRCDAGSLTFALNSNDTIRWYDSPGGNLLSTGNIFVTPFLTGSETYYVRAGTICPGNFLPVEAIISPITPDPVVIDQAHCGPGIILFNATATDTVFWYDSTNTILLSTGVSFTTPFLSQSATWYVRAGSECPSNSLPVQAMINDIPSDPLVTDQSRCGTGSVMLQATAATPVSWFDSPGGALLYSGNNFSTPQLSESTTFYAVAGTICLSNYMAVNAVINPVSADPFVNDQNHCGSGSITLSAIASDVVSWYDAPNGSLLYTGVNFTTPLLSQTTPYYAVAGTICPSNFIPVNAIISPISADPVVTDQSSCGSASLVLHATAVDSISWYDAPNGSLLHNGGTYTTPVLNQSEVYYARTESACPGNFVAAQALIFPEPSLNMGNDTIIESGTDVTLDAGNGFQYYQWNTGETTSYITVNSTGHYWVTITDANGCSASDTVQVLVTVNLQPYILTEGVLIYPNPGHHSISISFLNEAIEDIYMRLIEDNGKQVWSDFSIKERRVMRTIDVSHYARGFYIFQVATPSTKREFKVVLK